MADRRSSGLTILRIFLGVFFLFEGLSKLRWFASAVILDARLHQWLDTSASASMSRWYLEHIAIPGVAIFARLVPIAELCSGIALIAGIWTPLFAFVAFLMVLNFHFASGALFTTAFLTNGYGLPVLGATLALAIGGVRLPLSARR